MNFFLNIFKLNKFLIYFLILLVIIFFRIPFFFTDEFNWDESSYILIGQWIVDGNLPYVDRTAVKPPLLYYLYAFFVYLSSGEIFLIRFYGSLLLFINLIFLNKIFKISFNSNFNYVLLASFIFSSTFIIKDSNAVFSENFATLFLLISLYYFLKLKKKIDYFFLGFFLACACMVRLNLAIIPIVVFFFLIFKFRQNLNNHYQKILLYCCSGLGLVFVVFLPFIISGNLINAWNSIVVSGTSMVNNAPNSHLGALYYLLFRKSDIFDPLSFESFFRLIFWISSFFGFLLLCIKFKNEQFLKILIFYFAIFLSIFLGARASAHYLLLINAICSIFVSYFFIQINKNKYYLRVFSFSLILCIFVSLIQYEKIFKNYYNHGTLNNGIGFHVAEYLKKDKEIFEKHIYIYKKHIAYWFLGKYPPTDITHPSDINKEYLFEGWGKLNSDKSQEMIEILRMKPKYLVLNKNISDFMENFFVKNSEIYLNVIKNYSLNKKIDYIRIYKNKN